MDPREALEKIGCMLAEDEHDAQEDCFGIREAAFQIRRGDAVGT